MASEEGECRTGWIRLFGRTRPTMEPSESVITVQEKIEWVKKQRTKKCIVCFKQNDGVLNRMICEEQNNVVERQDSLVIVENGVGELEEGFVQKQTRIDSENIDNRHVERSKG